MKSFFSSLHPRFLFLLLFIFIYLIVITGEGVGSVGGWVVGTAAIAGVAGITTKFIMDVRRYGLTRGTDMLVERTLFVIYKLPDLALSALVRRWKRTGLYKWYAARKSWLIWFAVRFFGYAYGAYIVWEQESAKNFGAGDIPVPYIAEVYIVSFLILVIYAEIIYALLLRFLRTLDVTIPIRITLTT